MNTALHGCSIGHGDLEVHSAPLIRHFQSPTQIGPTHGGFRDARAAGIVAVEAKLLRCAMPDPQPLPATLAGRRHIRPARSQPTTAAAEADAAAAAAARPSPTGSDAERTQQGTPTYSSCSEEEQGEDGHDVSDPQPAATSIRRGGPQLQKQPQPQPAPSPGARDGDAVSSGKRVPTISTGDAGSVARSADDGEAGRRGPGRGAGATSSVAVAAADEDDASASSATTSTRSEASPAVSARAAGVYRTTHEMLFGQPHGFFAGYPVHRRSAAVGDHCDEDAPVSPNR